MLIGCGDVARRALPQLLRRWRVYALVRAFDPTLRAAGVTQITGDLDQRQSLRRLAALADAVLHCAPPPTKPANGTDDPRTQRLLAALASRLSVPRRLVYISTTGVYGDCAGALVDETRTLRPTTARARRRAAAERRLRVWGKRGVCVSILRAPGIYAAQRLPLQRLQRGDPVLPQGEDVFTNHIHADDLAAACLAALERGRANRACNISDDSNVLMGDWYDKLADAFALPRPPRLPRRQMATHLSPVVLSFMNESRRIDNARMKMELKLRLRYPTVDDGIAAALAAGANTCCG